MRSEFGAFCLKLSNLFRELVLLIWLCIFICWAGFSGWACIVFSWKLLYLSGSWGAGSFSFSLSFLLLVFGGTPTGSVYKFFCLRLEFKVAVKHGPHTLPALSALSSSCTFFRGSGLPSLWSWILSCIWSNALVLEAGGSVSSSLDEHPSSDPSSSFSFLTYELASSVICFNKTLFSSSFLTSQKACNTYLPTFIKSLYEKCFPAKAPLLAPAKLASKVKTNGIRSLWNIVILAVDSLLLGIAYVQSWKLK